MANVANGSSNLRITKLWQNLVSQLLVSSRKVADLLLTTVRIADTAQHVQHELLVLDAAVLNELLEAFPILSNLLGSDLALHLGLLEEPVQVSSRALLTTCSQTLVERVGAFRRSGADHIEALELTTILVLGSSDGSLHVLHLLLLLRLRSTQVGALVLVDHGSDVLVEGVLHEVVLGIGRSVAVSRAEALGSNHTISDINAGQLVGLALNFGIKVKTELRSSHLVLVEE